MDGNAELLPHSIRCLRAVEILYGGREGLSKEINYSYSTLNAWVSRRRISRQGAIALARASRDRFKVEEFLGRYD